MRFLSPFVGPIGSNLATGHTCRTSAHRGPIQSAPSRTSSQLLSAPCLGALSLLVVEICGGAAGGAAPSGDAARPLRAGHTFAFDGFFGWPRDDGTTKTISVEEMVVVTDDGAEWLIPPQEEWVRIPSSR